MPKADAQPKTTRVRNVPHLHLPNSRPTKRMGGLNLAGFHKVERLVWGKSLRRRNRVAANASTHPDILLLHSPRRQKAAVSAPQSFVQAAANVGSSILRRQSANRAQHSDRVLILSRFRNNAHNHAAFGCLCSGPSPVARLSWALVVVLCCRAGK